MASAFIDYVISNGKRVAFVVDRIELVRQSQQTFGAEKVSIIKAGYDKEFDAEKSVQVIMIQTFFARKDKLPELDLDYIIIDEVHNGWGNGRINELLRMYEDAKIIGLSATPIDERGYLLEGFDYYIDEIQTKDLINLGFLAKPICYMPESCQLDLSKISTSGNDYNNGELDKVLLDTDKVENIVDAWEDVAKGKKTIIFASSINHANALCLEYWRRGYKSLLLHSKLGAKELRESRGKLKDADIIINCAILTAGFDRKDLECVVLACPTKILRKYIQCVGRGLRVTENKKECIVIDCGNCFNNHGLPDDYRYYVNRPHKSDEPLFKQCPECGNIEPASAISCSICGYVFEEETASVAIKKSKKEIDRLVKIKSAQDELLKELRALVVDRGHKKGYSWWLFKDLLLNAKTQATGLIFYNKIMRRIEKCREKNYKIAWLRYQ